MSTMTVTLERASNGVAELRRKPFEVLLDGDAAGSIGRNQTLELAVEPGRHTLQVRSGRYSSLARAFDAASGTNIRFLCNGALFWPRYVASLLVPAIGLKLWRQ